MKSFLNLIQSRRSCRSFTEQKIPHEKVTTILKAGLWAPSSKNNRPWEFIVVEERDTLHQLSKCKPHGASFLSGAPLCIVVLGDPQKSDVWVEDCSIATILMQLTAEDIGLGSTWIQVNQRMNDHEISAADYIRQIMNIPDHLQVLALLAIGYKVRERQPYSDEELLWERIHPEHFGTNFNPLG